MRAYVKSIQAPKLPHSVHLSEFERRSVHKLASRELRQQETLIGIFLDDYPTWIWQIEYHGSTALVLGVHVSFPK